jgi:small subunit ribosomal protein S16
LAVKIRLWRAGAKNAPRYRVVVADGRAKRDGRFIETLGYYNPTVDPPACEIDEERALHWLGAGALPSETVRRMLSRAGVMKRFDELRLAAEKTAE